MTHRSQITDKWHRVCCGCGKRLHINELKQMDGNECCPGERVSRNMTDVKA